jgi:hypothetical protein
MDPSFMRWFCHREVSEGGLSGLLSLIETALPRVRHDDGS